MLLLLKFLVELLVLLLLLLELLADVSVASAVLLFNVFRVVNMESHFSAVALYSCRQLQNYRIIWNFRCISHWFVFSFVVFCR